MVNHLQADMFEIKKLTELFCVNTLIFFQTTKFPSVGLENTKGKQSRSVCLEQKSFRTDLSAHSSNYLSISRLRSRKKIQRKIISHYVHCACVLK